MLNRDCESFCLTFEIAEKEATTRVGESWSKRRFFTFFSHYEIVDSAPVGWGGGQQGAASENITLEALEAPNL